MVASRKSSAVAARKSSKTTLFGSEDMSFGLKDTLNSSSLAAKKRSGAVTPQAVMEPSPSKRRRLSEKSPPAKAEESADISFNDGLDLGARQGRRGAHREVMIKQCSELEDFVKDLTTERRRAARDAAKDQSAKPFSEAGKAEAMQACEDNLVKEKTKLQQMFSKLQDAFQQSQSTLEEYKAKIRSTRAQEEKDLAWVKQLEENVDQQLNELLSNTLKPKGKKMKDF